MQATQASDGYAEIPASTTGKQVAGNAYRLAGGQSGQSEAGRKADRQVGRRAWWPWGPPTWARGTAPRASRSSPQPLWNPPGQGYSSSHPA